jgi:hypothetical protein
MDFPRTIQKVLCLTPPHSTPPKNVVWPPGKISYGEFVQSVSLAPERVSRGISRVVHVNHLLRVTDCRVDGRAGPAAETDPLRAAVLYMIQPLVELYGGCMVVLKVS